MLKAWAWGLDSPQRPLGTGRDHSLQLCRHVPQPGDAEAPIREDVHYEDEEEDEEQGRGEDWLQPTA